MDSASQLSALISILQSTCCAPYKLTCAVNLPATAYQDACITSLECPCTQQKSLPEEASCRVSTLVWRSNPIFTYEPVAKVKHTSKSRRDTAGSPQGKS
ncbi:hypothetical protein K402DRAFT_250856 [Aulographum hederae CBS 113979]|uniref:Uncharacterized protein n=1 Tax=Aulographum hederae CBS 113979 TaxID=1176131 RepID=A0A6G1GJP6_9PEZI|nr:hypothetical protein K402DRAFT_250856 [Aulographum hederae CBS 113979]